MDGSLNLNPLDRRKFLAGSAAIAGLGLSTPIHADNTTTESEHREARSRKGIVTCTSLPACEVGRDILKAGGNAVDAAVAVGFAMAVTHPPAGNIGGGGFMIIHPPGAKPVCVDYRETAPAAATEKMFAAGFDPFGHKSVGVPGTVLGLATAHRRFGKLKWKQLVGPAVKLAAEGFAMDTHLAASQNEVLAESPEMEELQRVFGKDQPWKAGDNWVQKDLAESLDHIARRGPKGFYTGPVAEKLVAEMKAGGGLITLEDLQQYSAKIRKPIHTTFRGHDVFGPPPPSSGGIVLAQMLNVLETFELGKQGRFDPATLHVMIETMKRGFRDRAEFLGDADFVEIPAKLTQKKYAQRIADSINPKRATSSEDLAGNIKIAGEGGSTTHYSVIDAQGLAVSNTYTLEAQWGSRLVVRGAGFILNNEMGDFNRRPGHTDRLGRIGTPPNRIAPGKRMLSSQCPTIVARDGRPVLITGSPGGRTIINTVLCVVLNCLEFKMDLAAAVDAPRQHHSWLPDVAVLEQIDGLPSNETLDALREMGHKLSIGGTQGNAHSIAITADGYRGVADQRRFQTAALGLD